MSDRENPSVSAVRLALAVKRLRSEPSNLELAASEPIAIVGMGCRFPGGSNSPDEFWETLKEGRSGVREVPADRWKGVEALPEQIRRGGFLDPIDGFDAAYFGISPREAQHVDPQQRLMLEVVWEALWDAGMEPGSLSGAGVGVFAAIYNSDYARLNFRDPSTLTAHASSGSGHDIAAGRIAFLLNLKGPSLAIHSACSSSLVALHLACRSLRSRESAMAIVASSSLKLLPEEVVVFSKWGMLAGDGRCKTFDAAADGFGPGEGAGALILKPLANALEDGDRVRAVIRGTAVNQDGRTTVMSAPSGLAQEAVLRAALANAMIRPEEVDYIETHGTGTALGDPIEVEAIASVYGESTPGTPSCVLGAVKTNVGHMEASAGMAGVIKAALCMERGEIPRNLNFEKLNPEISLERTRLKLACEPVSWPRSDRPRFVGISSFGASGTNGHIILEEAPQIPAGHVARRQIPLPAHRWQRKRFWIPEPQVVAVKNSHTPTPISPSPEQDPTYFSDGSSHPLLRRRVDSAFVVGAVFESDLAARDLSYFSDHSLAGCAIAPMAALLEAACAAARTANPDRTVSIRNFAMIEPCFLSQPRSAIHARLQTLVADGRVEIASDNGGGWRKNTKASFETVAAELQLDSEHGPLLGFAGQGISELRERCREQIPPAEVYRRLETTGLRYGPAFRTLESVGSARSEALARVRLTEANRAEAPRYGLHPALLDGCLQSVLATGGAEGFMDADPDEDLFLPIGVDRFELYRAGMAEVWVHARMTAQSPEAFSADLTLFDDSGNKIARLRGLTARRVLREDISGLTEQSKSSQTESPAARIDTCELIWSKAPLAGRAMVRRDGERWLLIESKTGSLREAGRMLAARGAELDTIAAADFREDLLQAPAAWTDVVYDLRGLEANLPPGSAELGSWRYPEEKAVRFLIEFAKCAAASSDRTPKVWAISSSAAAVLPFEDVALSPAPVWGMLRTLSLEHPETASVWIDTIAETETDSSVEEMLAQGLDAGGADPMVAFRHGVRYVGRLERVQPKLHEPTMLERGTSGRLEDVHLVSSERSDPGPGEVEIEVRAAGLNFRDVLTALKMLPAHGPGAGAECSGVVVRVGSGVHGWKPGDNVLAFAPFSLRSHVNVREEFLAAKPREMSFAEAAGIPVAFLTAFYGLERQAGMAAGRTVLIHAAAGGLGLAAVALAQRAGARILATAGSPAKREFLKRIGVDQVFDSRSLAFRDQVLAATEGRGVDIVLNSLAGEFISASFDCVARGGCFLEVGKRGIWTAEEVTALGKSIRYVPFDLGDVAIEDPKTIADMLTELMRRFQAGELRPLPTALYAAEDASSAFRTMAQARHIGKLVLGWGGGNADPVPRSLAEIAASGTVLITGGLGALGLETARWLVSKGACSLVLSGRNAEGEANLAALADLRTRGADVAVISADIASLDDCRKLLDTIRATRPPLRAVFHAAGVVQDALLENESWPHYVETTAAKIQGAWNLDRLTREDEVDLLVLYSSAAAVLGSQAQGSYTAGNAFLDALAHRRASRGLRTLSVNWGAWASAGMAVRLKPELAARLVRQGVVSMEPSAALAALGRAIDSGASQVSILSVDWRQYRKAQPKGRRGWLSAFAESDGDTMPDRSTDQESAQSEPEILDRLRLAPAGDQSAIAAAHVKECARRVLGLDPATLIDEEIPLQEIGLDSLMALEMRNELTESLKIPLAAGLLFDYPAVKQLVRHLLETLQEQLAPAEAVEATDRSSEALDALTDEEAERLLLEELDRAGTHAADVEKSHA